MRLTEGMADRMVEQDKATSRVALTADEFAALRAIASGEMVVVPAEPTREMLDAFNKIGTWLETNEGTRYKIQAAFDNALGEPFYRAMLEAVK